MKLVDELTALGYVASTGIVPSEADKAPVDSIQGACSGTVPILRVSSSPKLTIELWMPLSTGWTRVETFVPSTTSDAGWRVVCRRAAESLRAYGLVPPSHGEQGASSARGVALGPSSAPPSSAPSLRSIPSGSSSRGMTPAGIVPTHPPVERPASVPPTQTKESSIGWIAVGPSWVVLLPSGHSQASGVVEAGVQRDALRAGFKTSLPIVAPEFEEREGVAKVSVWFVGASLMMTRGVGRTVWMGGVDASAVRVIASGRGSPGYRDGESQAWGMLAAGRVGVGYGISSQLKLQLSSEVGWILPNTHLALAGREVTRLGAPLVASTLGLSWVFARGASAD